MQIGLPTARRDRRNTFAALQRFLASIRVRASALTDVPVTIEVDAGHTADVLTIMQAGVVVGSFSIATTGGVASLKLNPSNGNTAIMEMTQGRVKIGYDGEAYVDSANKSVQLRTGGIVGLVITTARSVLLGRPSLAVGATDGQVYLPTIAGTPTGTPTAQAGYAPMVVDPTGSKLWVYVGGTWKSTTLA